MRVVACLIILLALGGCGTTKTINQQFQAELQQIHPGMAVADFRTILPEAAAIRQSTNSDGRISDIYEIDHLRTVENRPWWWPKEQEKVWFYFLDGQLVKWGAPED